MNTQDLWKLGVKCSFGQKTRFTKIVGKMVDEHCRYTDGSALNEADRSMLVNDLSYGMFCGSKITRNRYILVGMVIGGVVVYIESNCFRENKKKIKKED